MTLHKPLSPAIANERDLAAHLAALVNVAPDLAPISEAAGPLPLRHVAADFSGLAWIIVGQQISVAAGRAIFGRLEAALGSVRPAALLDASDETLRAVGLSIQKIRTLRASAQLIVDGFDLGQLSALGAEEAVAALSQIKGVGRWTAEVYLLFAVGHLDIFPAGDLALQEAARVAFGLDERPKEKALLAHAEAWRPHRSVAARLLWAYYRVAKGGRDATPV